MDSNSDEIDILCPLLAARDSIALEYLYQYARLLEVVLDRRFGPYINDEDRKDIVADALVYAWQTGDRFDPTLSSVKAWLIMVTVYRAREFLRRNCGGNNISIEQASTVTLELEHGASVEEQRPSARMKQLLQKLPARRARVIEMHYYEGRPVSEIASLLGITEVAVRSHLSNGRTTLRHLLEDTRDAL